MGSNAFDCPLRNSEEELCRSGQELNKRFEQTGSVDISAMVDSDEQFEAGPLQETQKRETISGNNAGDLQGKQKQDTNSGLQPSVQDILESKKLNATSFPQQGLGRCTPVGSHRHLLIDDDDNATIYRSITEKKNPRHDLKLDKLSEHEKKKLISGLVRIQNDGTVDVDLAKTAPDSVEGGTSFYVNDTSLESSNKLIPRLKIAILVAGTRGDVQPFLAIAKRLQEFGHHVRLATHANFKSFVRSAGVEFYPLGGDPRILAGYMIKNKGFIPSTPGDIALPLKQMKAVIESLLPACTEPDMETGVPFRAQAIIANPPAYGHVYVAEALGVPIHIFFTMPSTPTYEFPNPYARVPQAGYWLSYIVVDLLIWWATKGYINDLRKRKLKLPPISYFSIYNGSIYHLPTVYMWSPHLVPKPRDWGPLVDVVGYCFLNLGSKYKPREEFNEWIQKGTKPIYIGFGSMLLEYPNETIDIIMEALKATGQRGIIVRGWGDLGNFTEVPDTVFVLEDCPHDWLFPRCAAVVHHGGAGTTAAGLKAGCPTTIVPFFGDQFFWGDQIHKRGLGPAPTPIAKLSVESLSNAIRFMLQPEVKSRAMELAKMIEKEDGVGAAVDAFHRHLPRELPLPTAASLDEDEHPDRLQWFLIQLQKWFCLPCGV